jgi:hypothetical protein
MNSKRLHLSWVVPAAIVVAVIVTQRPGGSTLPTLLIALVCPAMMFFMMRGMHHGPGDHCGEHGDDHAEHRGDREGVPQ